MPEYICVCVHIELQVWSWQTHTPISRGFLLHRKLWTFSHVINVNSEHVHVSDIGDICHVLLLTF